MRTRGTCNPVAANVFLSQLYDTFVKLSNECPSISRRALFHFFKRAKSRPPYTASIKSPRELSSIVSTRVLSLIANRLNDKTITRPPLLFVHFFVDTFFDLSIFVSLSNRLILSRVKFHTFFSLSLFPRLFVTVRRNSLPPPRVTII